MYSLLAGVLRLPSLLFLALFLGLAYVWLKRPEDRRRLLVLIVPVFLVFLSFLPAFSYLVLGPLEWEYPYLEQRPADLDAIVVLSGSIRSEGQAGTRFRPGMDTLFRCLRAAEVYRQGKPCPVLLSGGKLSPDTPDPSCAEVMRDVLRHMEVRPDDMILEDQSHTTYENAVESCRLLRERRLTRVLLITDAAHLHRATACFRKQGVEVLPCGCRYRASSPPDEITDYLPDANVVDDVADAWHEWLGLGWYRVTGKI